jgi:uncharacterized membrane protein YphA (DoxX/SURF4 family)
VILLVQLVLGGTFLLAALGKLFKPRQFRINLAKQFGLSPLPAWLLAVSLPWLELGVSVSLLLGLLVRPAAVVGVALLLAFALAIAFAGWRGRAELECACFGTTGTPERVFLLLIRNLLLLALTVLVAVTPAVWAGSDSGDNTTGATSGTVPVALTAAGVLLAAFLLDKLRAVLAMHRTSLPVPGGPPAAD